MSTTKIRIEMANNSDASACRVLGGMSGVTRKHNGGKVVIAHVATGDLHYATDALEADDRVKGYEVQS